jgi:signal peptidase I
MRVDRYDVVRPIIRPGDVIAFGGEELISRVIMLFTNSPVSHVGVVERTQENNGIWTNVLVESTSLDGISGVVRTRLSERMQDYRGRIWWLPLSDSFRATLNMQDFWFWLEKQIGKPYNAHGAIDSALDVFEKIPFIGKWFRNEERYKRLFCSHLVCGALKMSGGLPSCLNPAEMTPRDLTAMSIYSLCVQLKGGVKDIKNFNRFPPIDFCGS